MNYCKQCGLVLDDENATLCESCAAEMAQKAPEIATPPAAENVLAGVVGAVLFSLVGGALYFIVYQLGYIAGIVGLAVFFLARVGYDLFGKAKGINSKIRLITCIIATIVAIFVAECLCLSYEIFETYKDVYDITFFDAVAVTPDFLAEPDIYEPIIGDLAFAYIFGGLAIVSDIIAKKKAEKAKL